MCDFGPYTWQRREIVKWRGYAVTVPPLALQFAANERRDRIERAAIIRTALHAKSSAGCEGTPSCR